MFIVDEKTFANWFNQKFIEAEQKAGHRLSIKQFAQMFPIPPQTAANWLNGVNVPSQQKYIELLVAAYGPEVYQYVGKSANVFNYDPISAAPPEIKSRFSAAIAEANHKYRVVSESGVNLSESEAASILTEAMAKYGFTTTPPSVSNPPEE